MGVYDASTRLRDFTKIPRRHLLPQLCLIPVKPEQCQIFSIAYFMSTTIVNMSKHLFTSTVLIFLKVLSLSY